jgi:transposase-like protein
MKMQRAAGTLLSQVPPRRPPGRAGAGGPELVDLADYRITEMAARYAVTYPAAMKCLLADREGLTACLRFPAEHHHRIRHSGFIGRAFGETRRRVRAIGRLPGETSCLTLAWAPCWTGSPAAGAA